MRYPPTFTQVSTIEEAEDILEKTNIDLVICMPGNADNDAFTVHVPLRESSPIFHALCSLLSHTVSHGV